MLETLDDALGIGLGVDLLQQLDQRLLLGVEIRTFEHDRFREVEALETIESERIASLELFRRLDLLGEERHPALAQCAYESWQALLGNRREIHLHDIGPAEERLAVIVHHPIVERDLETGLVELSATIDDLGVGFDVLENLDDDAILRKNFERIREEIRNGNTPQASIEAGYQKAFSTIADANITTLIAAIVLFGFGTGPIKGFAITLSIGIATSMFTAIMGTRAVINLFYGGRRVPKLQI